MVDPDVDPGHSEVDQKASNLVQNSATLLGVRKHPAGGACDAIPTSVTVRDCRTT